MRSGAAIFTVAEDRRSQGDAMNPELMRASGDRLQREPGETLAGKRDRAVVGEGALALVFVRRHALAVFARKFRQSLVDLAAARLGHAHDHGPIDLAHGLIAEGLAELRRKRGAA